ncbi:MAG: hypothetical protein AAFQ98_03890 [Bacteroidota bacterium]
MSTLTQYLKVFTEELESGIASLDAGDLTDGFDNLIRYQNANTPFLLKEATVKESSESQFVVTGKMDYLNTLDLPTEIHVSLSPDQEAQVTLRMRLLAPGKKQANTWVFSHSFPDLPLVPDQSVIEMPDVESPIELPYLDRLDISDAEFILTTHDHLDPIRQAPLKAGLNFVSNLRPEGMLGVLEYAFAGDADMLLYGTIRFPRATEVTQALAPQESIWQVTEAPGIHLKATLGIGFSLGSALTFGDTALQIYSPITSEWQYKNPTFEPVHGYTGTLEIPSADITLSLSSYLTLGSSEAYFRADAEGITLNKLTDLLDISGSDSLQSKLPNSLSSALDTLTSLELTRMGFNLQWADGLPQVSAVDLTIGFPSLNWEIWDDHFILSSLICDIYIDNPFASPWVDNPSLPESSVGKPHFGLTLRGLLAIEGVNLNVETRSKEDWKVYAYMPRGEQIPLGKLMSQWVPGIPSPADLTIDQLSVGFKAGESYDFSMTLASQPKPWSIPIGSTQLSISDVYFQFAKQSGQDLTGGFGGALSMAGQTIYIDYGIPGDIEIKGEFQNLSMQEIIKTLLGKKATLPDGLDFTFSTANLLLSKSGEDYLFQVAANIENFGFLGFELRKTAANGWGVVAGMSLQSPKLSALPGLGSLSALEKVVDLQELSLFIATYDGATLQFPALAKFGNPTLVGHNVPVTPGTGGLIAGVNFNARWQLDTSKKELKLLKTILGLNPTMDVTIQVSRVPSENSRLYFRFDTAFNNGKDPFSGQLGFALVNGTPSLFLAGRYETTIQGKPVIFDAAMSIVKGGIFFSGSMVGTLKFGSVQVSNLALVLGFNWAAIPTLGFAASLNIAGWQSSLAILFDSTDPSKSLLAGAISDVDLADIANSLAEGDIPKELEDILESFAITGTRPFTIPYDEIAEDLDERNLEAIVSAFSTYGSRTLTGNEEQVLMVVGKQGKKWSITDMADNLRHYQLEQVADGVLVSLNPQFYLAPAGTQMGTITFPQGYFVTGTLNILGLKWDVYVEIRNTKGIAVSSSLIRPLVIFDENFFKLSDVAGTGGPELSIATFRQPELEDKTLRDPHFYINGSVTLLGTTNEAYVKATASGFEFSISQKTNYSIPKNSVFSGTLKGNQTLNGNLGSSGTFGGGASFSLKVKGKMDVAKLVSISGLPKVSLDMDVSGSVSMGYDGKKAYANATGRFRYEGTQYQFNVKLQATNAQIKDAGKWVLDKLEDVLKDLLDTGDKLLEALEDGWLAVEGGAEATAKILTNGYGMAKKEALGAVTDAYDLGADAVAEVGKGLNMAADEVGDFMKDVKGRGDDAVSSALQGAKYATEEIWDFMQSAYGWFKHIDVKHYDRSQANWHGDASRRLHLDKKKHFDVKVKNWRPHLDKADTIGVNKRLTLTPHLDLPHADFRPTPKKPHMDQNGVNINKGKYGGQTYHSPHSDFSAGVKKKIAGKKFHLDAGHADTRLSVTAPKLPTSHIDVGHVDMGTSLDNPNKKAKTDRS